MRSRGWAVRTKKVPISHAATIVGNSSFYTPSSETFKLQKPNSSQISGTSYHTIQTSLNFNSALTQVLKETTYWVRSSRRAVWGAKFPPSRTPKNPSGDCCWWATSLVVFGPDSWPGFSLMMLLWTLSGLILSPQKRCAYCSLTFDQFYFKC